MPAAVPNAPNAELLDAIAALAVPRGLTVAVAESCTGGLVGAALTDPAGSSRYFLGGAVTYSNAEKTRALGVPAGLIEAHGAVSEPVVRAMADGVRRQVGATHAVAVSGVAGPGGGTLEKPVGTVWFAVASASGVRAERRRFPDDGRRAIRDAATRVALELLRDALAEVVA